MTPLGSWYHIDAAEDRLHMCNLRLVNSLFNDYIRKRLVAIHTCPDNRLLLAKTLQDATSDGNENFVRFLLSTGVDVDLLFSRSTPLFAAAINGRSGVVALLLERGADANIEGEMNETPIEAAATQSYRGIVELLLPYTSSFGIGYALVCAIGEGDEDTIEMILDSGFALDEKAKNLALQLAASYSDLFSVRRLLDHGVSATATFPDGHYPHCLHAAVEQERTDIAKLLLDHGAQVLVNTPNECGTPLQCAIYFDNLPMVRLLLEYGADPHAPAGQMGTALEMAFSQDRQDIVELLLEYGDRMHID